MRVLIRLAQNLEKTFFLILLSVGDIVPFGKCISDTKFYKKLLMFDPGSPSLKIFKILNFAYPQNCSNAVFCYSLTRYEQ